MRWTAALRFLLVGLVMTGGLLVPGCATTVYDETATPAVACIGTEGAETIRARARECAERCEKLREQYQDIANEREQLLKDEKIYRAKAANALRDPKFRESERKPYAQQYSTLADKRVTQAARCAEIMRQCQTRIAGLENKRQNLLRRAREHDRMLLPAPQ